LIVPVRYTGASGAVQKLRTAQVSFAANTLREAVFFRGQLGAPIAFREAMAGLHEVVTSDLKYRPRDRAAFRLWLEDQDRRFLEGHGIRNEKIRVRLEELHAQLDALRRRRERRLAPFHKARLEYLRWATENAYEVAYLLDPVITVHPDEIFFEAFSRDESSYARVGVKHESFASVSEFECGTTNIDFSHRLAGELSRMRSYRQTAFEIAPAGLAVTTGATSHVEKKIDLPESWVQGFLQVHSTMAMGLHHVRLTPLDLFNICRQLKRRKARTSPRALRYELVPGQPVRAVLEPWEHVIELSNTYEGPKPVTVRTWGRDRLLTLARLIPIARRVDLYLAGLGLPSIYVVEAEGLTFTFALSGWTDNDWTGGAQFDLLTRRLSATTSWPSTRSCVACARPATNRSRRPPAGAWRRRARCSRTSARSVGPCSTCPRASTATVTSSLARSRARRRWRRWGRGVRPRRRPRRPAPSSLQTTCASSPAGRCPRASR